MTRDATRFLRFSAVGVVNTALTVVAFALLSRAGVAPSFASALGFALGATNGYVLNRSWTFGSQGGRGTFSRYLGVQAVGGLMSAGGVSVATDLALRHLAAECVVIPFVTLVTYTLARRVVFASHPFRPIDDHPNPAPAAHAGRPVPSHVTGSSSTA